MRDKVHTCDNETFILNTRPVAFNRNIISIRYGDFGAVLAPAWDDEKSVFEWAIVAADTFDQHGKLVKREPVPAASSDDVEDAVNYVCRQLREFYKDFEANLRKQNPTAAETELYSFLQGLDDKTEP